MSDLWREVHLPDGAKVVFAGSDAVWVSPSRYEMVDGKRVDMLYEQGTDLYRRNLKRANERHADVIRRAREMCQCP